MSNTDSEVPVAAPAMTIPVPATEPSPDVSATVSLRMRLLMEKVSLLSTQVIHVTTTLQKEKEKREALEAKVDEDKGKREHLEAKVEALESQVDEERKKREALEARFNEKEAGETEIKEIERRRLAMKVIRRRLDGNKGSVNYQSMYPVQTLFSSHESLMCPCDENTGEPLETGRFLLWSTFSWEDYPDDAEDAVAFTDSNSYKEFVFEEVKKDVTRPTNELLKIIAEMDSVRTTKLASKEMYNSNLFKTQDYGWMAPFTSAENCTSNCYFQYPASTLDMVIELCGPRLMLDSRFQKYVERGNCTICRPLSGDESLMESYHKEVYIWKLETEYYEKIQKAELAKQFVPIPVLQVDH